MHVAEVRCTSCLAPIDPSRGLSRCGYCGATLVVAGGARPIASADFRTTNVPGWNVRWDYGRLAAGPELLAQTPGDGSVYRHLLESQVAIDDCRVMFAFRLLSGDMTTTRAGLLLRKGAEGFYAACLSTQGTVALELERPNQKVVRLLPWTKHHAAKTTPGDVNEMSVELRGDRIRFELNGAVAALVRDASCRHGRVVAVCLSDVPAALAVRRLDLLELAHDAPAAPPPAPLAPPPIANVGVARPVVLRAIGGSKIAVIKVVRETTGCGLKEAKELVESAPCTVGHFPDPRARAVAQALVEAGADAIVQ